GKRLNGAWTLKVADLGAGDTGSIAGWGTRLSEANCDVSSNAPPAAAFGVSPAAPVTGQAVAFTSTSSDPDGTIASQAWDLDGDGKLDSGVSGASVSRSYAAPGTYTVTLEVTDDNGATATQTGTVTIDNRAPTAKFGYAPSAPATGDSVTFTSESTD